MNEPHVWIVEKLTKKGWVPHESYDYCDTKKEARKISNRDHELRTVCYVRRIDTR